MRACQREARLSAVIESPARPGVGRVAKSTICSQPPLMMGIAMASGASCGRVLEGCGLVALFAGHNRVPAQKRKAREIMIEGHLLSPRGFVVTLLAVLAELPLMRVVLLMTGDAGGPELVTVEFAGVAAIAFNGGVSASQRKLGRAVMIEADC